MPLTPSRPQRGEAHEGWRAGCAATLALAALTAGLISINWGVYVWSIANDHALDAALGYYINPLMYVLVGVLFFGERLRRAQTAAVLLAATGVAVLTISGGEFPLIAPTLQFLVGLAYGETLKQAAGLLLVSLLTLGPEGEIFFFGLVVWGYGLVWILVTRSGLLRPQSTGMVLGAIAMLVGAQITVGEFIDDGVPEDVLVVQHVVRDAQALGHLAGVVDVLAGAAGALLGQSRAVIVELQRDAHDIVALALQEAGHDRGVDAARHGDHDAGGLRPAGKIETPKLTRSVGMLSGPM